MKSSARTCWTLFFLSLSTLSACGGSGDGPGGGGNVVYGSCEEIAACGGDPTGSWTLDGACFDLSQFETGREDCDMEFDAAMEASGTLDLHADGTYVSTITAKARSRSIYHPGCLSTEGGTLTCEQLDAGLRSNVDRGDSGYESAGCAVVDQRCVCEMVMSETTRTETGTWAVSGTTLTIARDGQTPRSDAFCVQGSSLTIGVSVGSQADDAPATTMTSYMRFTRR